jgi:capsid protein
MARYPTLTRNGFLLPERIKASYDGAGEGRRSATWDAPDGSVNSLMMPALRNLRSRSRAAVRNDPYAFNAIDKRVSNLIGAGITPGPRWTTRCYESVCRNSGGIGLMNPTPMA